MNNFFYSSSNLITNFKPSIVNNLNDYNAFKKNKYQKFCKNFLIYVLIFKYKSNFFRKSNIFIKKYKKNVYTILRSPYRHKLARHQLFLQRYNINFSIWIKLSNYIFIKKYEHLLKIFVFLKNFSKIFESNLIFINNIKFSVFILYKNNFLIKNYFYSLKI